MYNSYVLSRMKIFEMEFKIKLFSKKLKKKN